MGVQLVPPFDVFHIPPEADPTYIVLLSPDTKPTQFILPNPAYPPGVLVGPKLVQLPLALLPSGFSNKYFSSSSLAEVFGN